MWPNLWSILLQDCGIDMVTKSALMAKTDKQAQALMAESPELSHALVRSAGTGIYIVQEGRFVYVNSLFQELTGYSEAELIGTYCLDHVHPEDRETVRKRAIESLMEQSLLPYEYRFINKNGSIMWILERVTTTEYRGLRATVGSFMDITEQKMSEEELKQSLNDLRRAMEGAVQAIALIIESRDPYTAGHQRRVTYLACAIAEEMGLSPSQVDGIRMAGSTHDIGKIHVPAEILSKPGRLADFETSIIKTHPQIGYDVLKEINFPFPVAQIVLQHHERMDGSGYPYGLSGEDILLEARIISVADVVEAMSSHRPYRPAIGIDSALQEISQNSGILYDSDAVIACLRLFNEKGFRFEQ